MRRVHLALAGLVALLALPLMEGAASAAADETAPITLGQGTRAQAMVSAPDGNLWFTANKYGYDGFTNVIGRVTPAGEVAEYPLPKRDDAAIGGIVVGSAGNLWFADTAVHAIGRSDLGGQVTEFPLPQGSVPTGVALGPDGAVWFTEAGSDHVGRIDGSGSITAFPLPVGSHPLGLAAADGALWVTENGRDSIARVALDGTVAEYPLPHPESKPKEIVRGADGNLWFGEEEGFRVGRIDPAGAIAEFDVPGTYGGIGALAAAADGTIYFTTGTNRAWIEVGALSPAGELTGLGCVTAYCNLPVSALAVGPIGDLWYGTDVRYTEGGGGGGLLELYVPGTVGRFQPPGPVAVAIPGQALRVRGRLVRIGLSCQGGPQARCGGTVALEAPGRTRGARSPARAVYATRSFRLAAGSAHRFTMKVSRFGMSHLRRGSLRVTVRVTVHGGPEATRTLTLHPPRRH